MTPRRRTAPAAFTLLEVILAVSLTVLLMGSAYAFYAYALAARDALRDEADTRFAQRRILDLIAADLTAAVDAGSGFGLSGSSRELSLVRAGLPPASVYAEPSAVRARDDEEVSAAVFGLRHDLQLVRYVLETDEEGEVGPLRRATLEAAIRGSDDAGRSVVTMVESETPPVSNRIKFLRFEYLGDGTWADSWSRGGLPRAVRVTLGVRPLPEDVAIEEYPYETVSRAVLVPCAAGAGEAAPAARSRRPGR